MKSTIQKNRIWFKIKRFWVIQNNKSVIDSINKHSSRKKAKQVEFFDFLTLYTKITHSKFLAVLNSIILRSELVLEIKYMC